MDISTFLNPEKLIISGVFFAGFFCPFIIVWVVNMYDAIRAWETPVKRELSEIKGRLSDIESLLAEKRKETPSRHNRHLNGEL